MAVYEPTPEPRQVTKGCLVFAIDNQTDLNHIESMKLTRKQLKSLDYPPIVRRIPFAAGPGNAWKILCARITLGTLDGCMAGSIPRLFGRYNGRV